MNIVIDIVLLLAGFVLLIKGADFFVEGASSLVRKLRIPSLVVGLTIVALGTSAPELAVSISASLGGQNSMAVSNVIGSNILNILCILGVSGVISPITITGADLSNTLVDFGIYIVICLLAYIFCLTQKKITRVEGGILVFLYIAYMGYAIVRDHLGTDPIMSLIGN